MNATLKPFFDCLSHLRTPDESARRRFTADEDDFLGLERNPFRLDAEQKLLPSKCMRRLMDKTAVYTQPSNQHVRTRLSHSFDVANNASALARILGLNDSLAFACGLGHDVGHTPFGHSGESFIRKVTGKQFRHEVFGVVLLQKVERHGGGVNLTHQVLHGILKHSRGKGFFSTNPEVTPEGNLIPLCDSIAYLFADANDTFDKLRCVDIQDLPELQVILNWFGTDQRVRTFRCFEAICRESAAKGEVAFAESEEATKLKELKRLMYEKVYGRIHPPKETDLLENCYKKLETMNLAVEPALALALMTDEEVIHIATTPAFTQADLTPLAIGEILRKNGRSLETVDFMNADMDW